MSESNHSCATFCDDFGNIRASGTFKSSRIPFTAQPCLNSLQEARDPGARAQMSRAHVFASLPAALPSSDPENSAGPYGTEGPEQTVFGESY